MAKPDWITLSPSSHIGEGRLNITFAENTSTSPRSGIVTVKTISGLTHEIQVNQAGKVANSIQGSGRFCYINVLKSAFPDFQVGIIFYAQIVLSNGTKVKAGSVLIVKEKTKNTSVGYLTLDSEKLPISGQANITHIQVTCNPPDEPTPYYDYCTGKLSYNPGNIAFGVVGSSQIYPATFEQFTNTTWGFRFSTPIPISGDTTLVYKGNTDEVPGIVITKVNKV